MPKTTTTLTALFAVAAMALTACGGDPYAGESGTQPSSDKSSGSASTLVVGSQEYYSNEILAEVYAQGLEGAGFTVERQLGIGQREVYMPEIVKGSIDVFPEYTGNLLQYLEPGATATAVDEVHASLQRAMPDGLRALDQAEASDQDSFVTTKALADKHDATSVADLAGVEGLTLGGNSELETRPYGPKGLKEAYGVAVAFTPIEDSGGPLTVKALRDGAVQLVDIYSADPVLAEGDLVRLEDPKGLLLASHVVPIVSDKVDEKAAEVLDRISAKLAAKDLVAMNARSVNDQVEASVIAKEWLADQGL